jgi:hypothetical protein
MPLGVWLPMLAEHGGRVSPCRWGLVASVSLTAAFNSLAEPLSEARYRRQLRQRSLTEPPLFIVGHWRSGTTLLHELLMHDEQFCCPTTYQCFAPGHFLLTEGMVTSMLRWIMPAKRPMDDVATGWHRPQEDEFAMVNMGAPSPYRRMAFPLTSPPQPVALDIAALPVADRQRWETTLRRFLARLAVRDPRRPVLKSPPHTARTAVLAEMFPGARFLHIVRDPFVVFPSTVRLWRSLEDVQSFQVGPTAGDAAARIAAAEEEYVFTAFETMYAAFERDRPRLPAGSLHELRYEDLVADPVGRLAEAYAALGIGGFDRVRPALRAEAEAMKRYRTNTYRHDPRIVDAVARRWRGYVDRYGYEPPAT